MSGISRLAAPFLVGVVALAGCGGGTKDELKAPLPDLRAMHEYHGASGSFQVIVNVDKDIPVVPNFLQGRHVMFLAQGSVEGVVDFSNLDDDAVKIDGKSVKIRLPHAELKDVQWDVDASRVLDQDRGLFTAFRDLLGKNPDTRPFFTAAEPKVRDAANKTDMIAKTEENTRRMLTGLFVTAGYETVKIDWQDSPA